ncbi:dihydrofolate reductase [Kribbella caucasensis]|uniref:dihydrofolate reductase n=1 Tax=Kribbella caucasensis TaxID=2512215 RepID=UPI00351A155F
MSGTSYPRPDTRLGTRPRLGPVVTRQPDWTADRVTVTHSLEEALAAAASEEVFIAGGEQIYRDALPIADRLEVTEVDRQPDGDVFFPEINQADWREIARNQVTATHSSPTKGSVQPAATATEHAHLLTRRDATSSSTTGVVHAQSTHDLVPDQAKRSSSQRTERPLPYRIHPEPVPAAAGVSGARTFHD